MRGVLLANTEELTTQMERKCENGNLGGRGIDFRTTFILCQ